MKRLRKLVEGLRKRFTETIVEEPFVTLIQVADETPEIRATLLSILQTEAFHRNSLLNTLIEEMRLKGAPEALITGITSLLDPRVAQRALELLKKN
jgi:hypothetical protein